MTFSASIQAADAAGALVALEMMYEELDRIQRLSEVAERIHRELSRMGFDIGRSVSLTIPILVGDDTRTVLTLKGFKAGIFVNRS